MIYIPSFIKVGSEIQKFIGGTIDTQIYRQPITVAVRSKAGTVFARSNAGIVGSNPTQGMDVCL
jgi:hypothetical protein